MKSYNGSEQSTDVLSREDIECREVELQNIEAKKRKPARKRRRISILGLLSFIVGIVMIGVGVKMMLPDFMSLNDFKNLSQEVKKPSKKSDEKDSKAKSDDEKADKDKESKDESESAESGSEGSTEADYDIDWDALYAQSEDTVAWVSVDNTDIDFPVVQGDDNWWYLYHDIFGRESYASVFMDYRCDPNGMNDIVYAHTHWANTGFHQIAQVDEQWYFDQVGTVHYYTPDKGVTNYTPIAGLYVYPQFSDVQLFQFEPEDADLQAMQLGVLASHATNNDWNLLTIPGTSPGYSEFEAVPVDSEFTGADHWWVLTEAEKKDCYRNAQLMVFRTWLRQLCSQGSAQASGMDDKIDSATRCLVLACCSWPYDSHRTLLVCVN